MVMLLLLIKIRLKLISTDKEELEDWAYILYKIIADF